MASAERFDLQWLDRNSKVERALQAVRISPPEGVRDCTQSLHVAAIGIFAAMALPPFAPFTAACKQPMSPTRVSDCRALGLAMRRSDSLIVQAIGFHIGIATVAQGSEEERELNQARRRFEWVQMQIRELGDRGQQDLLRLAREYSSEIDMADQLLRENSVPLDPPADWISPRDTPSK